MENIPSETITNVDHLAAETYKKKKKGKSLATNKEEKTYTNPVSPPRHKFQLEL